MLFNAYITASFALSLASLANAASCGSTCHLLKGRIKVTGPNNADMGYVAADLSNKVGLQLFRPGACAADALVVAFNIADALQSKTKPMDLYILNGNSSNTGSNNKFLGGIVGFGNLDPTSELNTGTLNYAYLGATAQTQSLASAVEGTSSYKYATGRNQRIESRIWTYDLLSYSLTPQWTNTARSLHAATILHDIDQDELDITGDVTEYKARFDVAYPVVTFKFEVIIL